jgi:transposase-like protein
MAKSRLSEARFHDESAAFAHLEGLLWPQGPVCPKCGGEGYALNGVKDKKGRVRLGLKKCRACRAQFTVRVNTIFEDSHIPLHLWLQAIALLASSKKGISSNQLHRTLGITLKSAWHMSHRIRLAMATKAGSLPPLGGEGRVVEIDETYHGRVENPAEMRKDGTAPLKRGKKGYRGPANRRAVVALIERGGNARVFHVAEANAATIQKIVRENIHPLSRVHTDASSLYKFAKREFAEHKSVEHSMGEYVRYEENGAVHNNSCESYFSVLKKGLNGVYQHCREKHLFRYLDEFSFRHNHRVALGVGDEARADAIIMGVVGKRLTYRKPDGTAAV